MGVTVFGGVFLLLGLAMLGVVVGGTLFWIWMIVDCATKESTEGNDKVVWLLIIVFTHLIGALLYYLIRRPARIADLGH